MRYLIIALTISLYAKCIPVEHTKAWDMDNQKWISLTLCKEGITVPFGDISWQDGTFFYQKEVK